MITIDGNATVFPDGDAEITFQSNVDKVSFECVRVADDEDMPEISPCKNFSPHAADCMQSLCIAVAVTS